MKYTNEADEMKIDPLQRAIERMEAMCDDKGRVMNQPQSQPLYGPVSPTMFQELVEMGLIDENGYIIE